MTDLIKGSEFGFNADISFDMKEDCGAITEKEIEKFNLAYLEFGVRCLSTIEDVIRIPLTVKINGKYNESEDEGLNIFNRCLYNLDVAEVSISGNTLSVEIVSFDKEEYLSFDRDTELYSALNRDGDTIKFKKDDIGFIGNLQIVTNMASPEDVTCEGDFHISHDDSALEIYFNIHNISLI